MHTANLRTATRCYSAVVTILFVTGCAQSVPHHVDDDRAAEHRRRRAPEKSADDEYVESSPFQWKIVADSHGKERSFVLDPAGASIPLDSEWGCAYTMENSRGTRSGARMQVAQVFCGRGSKVVGLRIVCIEGGATANAGSIILADARTDIAARVTFTCTVATHGDGRRADQAVQWRYETVTSDKEERRYSLPSRGAAEPRLLGPWRCRVDAVEHTEGDPLAMERSRIMCMIGEDGQMVGTTVSCSRK